MTGTYAAATPRLPLGFVNWTSAAAKRGLCSLAGVTHLSAIQTFYTIPACTLAYWYQGVRMGVIGQKYRNLFSRFSQRFSKDPRRRPLPVLFVKYGNGTASKYAQNEVGSV